MNDSEPIRCDVAVLGRSALAAAPGGMLVDPSWSVWSVVPGFRIDALAPGGPRVIRAARLVVALDTPPGPAVLRLLHVPHVHAAGRWQPRLGADGATGIPGLFAVGAPHPPVDWAAALAVTPGDAVVCACEGVTRAGIEAAVAEGARDMNQLKHFTRCGMGACQGRECEELAGAVLGAQVGGAEAAGRWTVRPPLMPLPLAALTGAFDYGDIPVPPPAPP